jgi:hypothetical protein
MIICNDQNLLKSIQNWFVYCVDVCSYVLLFVILDVLWHHFYVASLTFFILKVEKHLIKACFDVNLTW